jgi:hypothetical protein
MTVNLAPAARARRKRTTSGKPQPPQQQPAPIQFSSGWHPQYPQSAPSAPTDFKGIIAAALNTAIHSREDPARINFNNAQHTSPFATSPAPDPLPQLVPELKRATSRRNPKYQLDNRRNVLVPHDAADTEIDFSSYHQPDYVGANTHINFETGHQWFAKSGIHRRYGDPAPDVAEEE